MEWQNGFGKSIRYVMSQRKAAFKSHQNKGSADNARPFLQKLSPSDT